MNSKFWLSTLATALLIFITPVRAEDVYPLKTGWGSSVSASTTPAYLTVEHVEGSDLVSNGTFDNTNDWILASNWSVSGNALIFTSASLLLNGTFATTNSWTTNTIWNIADGTGNFMPTTANTSSLIQAQSVVSGTTYQVKYTISGMDVASNTYLQTYIGLTTGTEIRVADGTYTDTILALSNNAAFSFLCGSDGADTVRVDNVSMRVANLAETGDSYQTPSAELRLGASYRLRYTVSGLVGSATVQPLIDTQAGTVRTADGTYTEDITCSNASGTVIFRGSTTNISTISVGSFTMRAAPKAARAKHVELSVGALSAPVYVSYNIDSTMFTNAYATSKCIMINSNTVNRPYTIDVDDPDSGVETIWYRSATGTPTLIINAN